MLTLVCLLSCHVTCVTCSLCNNLQLFFLQTKMRFGEQI